MAERVVVTKRSGEVIDGQLVEQRPSWVAVSDAQILGPEPLPLDGVVHIPVVNIDQLQIIT